MKNQQSIPLFGHRLWYEEIDDNPYVGDILNSTECMAPSDTCWG